MTGITGYIGRNWMRHLIEDHEIIGLGHPLSSDQDADFVRSKIAYIPMDLERPLAVERLPKTVDAVVHLAQGQTGASAAAFRSMFMVNVAATNALDAYATQVGAKIFCFASTGNVYLPSTDPLYEECPLAYETTDYYTYTKIAAERFLRLYRVESAPQLIITRLFVPYGPGQVRRMIPKLIELVRDGKEITLTNGGHPFVNPIFITDLCDILSTLLVRGAGCTVNIGGDTTYSVREIAELIGQVGNWPVRFREVSTSAPSFNLIGKSTVLQRLLGTEAARLKVDLPLGLARMIHTRTFA